MAFGREVDPNIGKETQFQPGVSGNPSGKPKGTKHLSTWIQDLLNDQEFKSYIPDARDGFKEFKGAPMQAIIKAMMIKAIMGDVKAFDALAKYGYGQKLTLANDEENPITPPVDPKLSSEWTEFLKSKTQDE